MDWQPDWNLRLRMAVAVGLVFLLPFAFVTAMLWVFNVAVPTVASAFEVTFNPDLQISSSVLLVVVLLGVALQYLFGEKLALRSVGARTLAADDRPDLRRRVDRLAQQADLQPPELAVVNTEMPNAFAMGRSPSHATVVVTSGLLDALDGDELDAVLAHELAHIKNRDVTVMTVAYLLPTLTYVVAVAAYTLLRVFFDVGHALHDTDDGRAVAAALAIFLTTTILTLAISAFFWVSSFLLFRVLSQYRERAADRAAARLTGNPLALASALETIDGEIRTVPDRDLREYDGGIEALYIAPLDTPTFTDDDDALLSTDVFPDTHPSTASRISELREMAGELERT
ncbi:peptidase M48 Ste24p [Haloprofundus marisrubri]|uniref:Protease HtpX homolog n=1 Tax=Haloprofundus marisrubri TaxID=1514971 RepID=A0A0W1RA36_9EURY|nr:M48 family metalloprotease [Haloprofundus marisrubri]KTG10316.1 peptidase M48 Ste24p [Haloprofundus marisrubri]